MLSFRLLGPPAIHADGRSLGSADHDKGLLLLAYLAATAGEKHARAALAAQFWPQMASSRALHNLRQLLLRLRGLLPAPGHAPLWLLTDARTLAFNREADYWLDLEQFLQPGDYSETSSETEDETAVLTQRAALYRGPFLAGCDAQLGDALADWLTDRRAACQQIALRLETTLFNRHAASGQLAQAIHHAQRCVELEPWQESGRRSLMRLLAKAGQHAAALHQYAQLCQLLQREMGVTPEAETAALAEQIRQGDCAGHVHHGDHGEPVFVTTVANKKPAPQHGERRPVTVFECGLVCVSECQEDCTDPEVLATRFERPLEQLGQIIEAHGGHIERLRPDGCCAFFGWPRPDHCEHAARDAALAALAILRDLHLAHPGVAVTIGIDSGVMLDGLGLQGCWAVHERALRLRVAAGAATGAATETGMALLGASMQASLRDDFVLAALPAQPGSRHSATWRLLGIRETNEIDEANDANAANKADEAEAAPWPCLGRRAELDTLARGWRLAHKGGVQVFSVVGEAGLGKTRLLREFARSQAVMKVKAAAIHWLACTPRGRETPLLPLISLLRKRFGLDKTMTASALRARLGAQARELLPLFTAQTPPSIGQKPALLQALSQALIATDAPTLLILEDAHWADASTLEWLDSLLHTADENNQGLMLLISARQTPALSLLPPELARRNRQLTLAPLDAEAACQLAQHVAGMRGAAAMAQSAMQSAQGVPLFIIELARIHAASPAGSAGKLPASLRGLLQARLDQAGTHKKLLQTAAILGEEFSLADWRQLACAAGLADARSTTACAALLAAGLLAATDSPERMRFTHALLQQAALDSLPAKRRVELHLHRARCLQERGGAAASIAWHLSEGRLATQAAEYWLHAARQSCRLEAYRETTQLAERALASQPALATELATLLLAAYAHMALGGYFDATAQALYARARTLAAEDGTEARTSLATLRGHWLGASSRASHREARAIAEEMITIADQAGLDHFRGMARYLAGNSALWQGDFSAARKLLETAVKQLERDAQDRIALDAHDQDFQVTATGYLGWVCWFCGETARGLELGRQALALAHRRGHLMTQLHAASTLSCICMYDNRAEEVLALAEEMIASAQSAELSMWASIGQLNRYWALAKLGRAVAADVAAADQYLNQLLSVYPGGAAGFHAMMTEAALQRGALAELPDRLAALQHSVSTTEAGLYAATLLLFEAELACLQQQPRRAAAKFREAAQVAAIQGATTLQAQALQGAAAFHTA